MRIAVAGKYSAETETERRANFDAMNEAAARLLEMGHTPLIGVNAALPVVERAGVPDAYEAVMRISMAKRRCVWLANNSQVAHSACASSPAPASASPRARRSPKARTRL
jgi:hypothetical protein